MAISSFEWSQVIYVLNFIAMRYNILTIVSLVIMAFLFPFLGLSQYTISGRVTDAKTGQELIGAHVVIKESGKATISNESGGYLFERIGKGSWSIQFSYLGYKTEIKSIALKIL